MKVMETDSVWASITKLLVYILSIKLTLGQTQKLTLPQFKDLQANYPGYFHYNGRYRNHEFLEFLQLRETGNLLIHDTSALRLSQTLNQIGGQHSLGTEPIRFSKFGHDSIQGKNDMQYIFLPIAYGPYLADKYGYPNITKLHLTDPLKTKHSFWGKQGILRVITYTHHGNEPKGHVALWDCSHFHQSRDWIAGNSLLTVEFWQSPDSNCPDTEESIPASATVIPDRPVPKSQSKQTSQSADNSDQSKLGSLSNDQSAMAGKYLKHIIYPKNARHSLSKVERMKSDKMTL